MNADPLEKSLENSTKSETKQINPGIVYFSKIPNGMIVNDIKNYFSEFVPVKSYFVPLKKSKKLFKEGWIEFKSSANARHIEKVYNCTKVGGKKTKKWYDDVWSLKYIKGLSWSDIHAETRHKNLIKSKEKQADLSIARREADVFQKFSKLSEDIQKGRKKSDDKVIKYNQFGSDNITSKRSIKNEINDQS